MKKIRAILIIVLAIMLMIFICAGTALAVYADEIPLETNEEYESSNTPVTEEIEINTDNADIKAEGVMEWFLSELKIKYGSDYDYYYNIIIEQWGSVENYLISAGSILPEEYQSGWEMFVGWLDTYKVIWGPFLAVVIIIIVAVVGKKQFNRIVETIVNLKLSPIIKELNLQSGANVSIVRALKALLGTNSKFAETVAELDKAEKELESNE